MCRGCLHCKQWCSFGLTFGLRSKHLLSIVEYTAIRFRDQVQGPSGIICIAGVRKHVSTRRAFYLTLAV